MKMRAIIDGCSRWGRLFVLILPLSQLRQWDANLHLSGRGMTFARTLIVLNSNEMRTLTVGLTIFNGEYWSEQGIIMAGAVFTSLPIVIVFLFLQKRISGSVLAGLAADRQIRGYIEGRKKNRGAEQADFR
ncbi:MAG: carbohydrate ABC transporter permease [Anaerolineales bacterium]|nr:carbohydrate ABC transporter permease [Anaerolineales bacterium]